MPFFDDRLHAIDDRSTDHGGISLVLEFSPTISYLTIVLCGRINVEFLDFRRNLFDVNFLHNNSGPENHSAGRDEAAFAREKHHG